MNQHGCSLLTTWQKPACTVRGTDPGSVRALKRSSSCLVDVLELVGHVLLGGGLAHGVGVGGVLSLRPLGLFGGGGRRLLRRALDPLLQHTHVLLRELRERSASVREAKIDPLCYKSRHLNGSSISEEPLQQQQQSQMATEMSLLTVENKGQIDTLKKLVLPPKVCMESCF